MVHIGSKVVEFPNEAERTMKRLEDQSVSGCLFIGWTPENATLTSEPKWLIKLVTFDGSVLETRFANNGKWNAIWDDKETYFDPCTPGPNVPGTVDTNVVSDYDITTFTTNAVANTEETIVIPTGTKRFTLQNRGVGQIKIGREAGEIAAGTYFTVAPGTQYWEDELGLPAAGITFYIESPSSSQVLEILRWF